MATKIQALAWLAVQAPINAVGVEKLVKVSDVFGDRVYMVNVRKVNVAGDTVRYENIYFVVVDEGLPAEKAYFLGNNTIAWENVHETPPVVP